MKLARVRSILPDWKNVLAASASAILLIGAFPDFEFWFLAWFALVPLLWAVEREKGSAVRSFVLGWVFGTVFFFGTCWWLTFAPITYAGFPPALAYLLMFGVTAIVGIFPGIFAGVLSVLLKRFGSIAILATPFIWVFTEFLRYLLTGNDWNAIGYSQFSVSGVLMYANIGGILLTSFIVFLGNLWLGLFLWLFLIVTGRYFRKLYRKPPGMRDDLPISPLESWINRMAWPSKRLVIGGAVCFVFWYATTTILKEQANKFGHSIASIVAIQPNVPMSGLTSEKWKQLRQRHVQLAESVLAKLNQQWTFNNEQPITVIFPESPMNFMYEDDRETQEFINLFAAKNNVSVLFNSAEPDSTNGKFFNSAVMVGPEGKEIAQYDKIYLVPFGESVPALLQGLLPAFVGGFSYGSEYDLFPLGDAKAGVMICFESHFGQLSREYVRNGADVIIEMTNDGYLGPTPVLRQHLANAVFRAVETNRPVLRVTNVGITAYINARGEVLDPAVPYTEDTRVWSVSKSDGKQTFYVRYGDWFAWLCSAVTVGLLIFGIATKPVALVAVGDNMVDKNRIRAP